MTSDSSRYEVLGHLASGGMGEILLARRRGPAGFTKLVVLKRPLASAPGSRRLADALIAEARLLARINHPNVCQIHDLEEADGQYFLTLELLEGLSLWTVLARAERSGGPVDPRVLCGLFAQVCDGLAAIHELRASDGSPACVVHRDISPGNLFVTKAGLVKILDLGIAKHADSEDLTPFGNIKGKLPYVAPEQAAGKPADARADLFALGLVIYDLARGRCPPSDRIGALACDALELGELPRALAEVIGVAVRADRGQRYASASAMGAAINRAGAVLGGVADHAQIAAWLERHHAEALEEQRQRISAALTGKGAETSRLRLRSAFDDTEVDGVLDDGDESDVPDHAAIEPLGFDDAPLAPRTERLAIDDDRGGRRDAPVAPREKREPISGARRRDRRAIAVAGFGAVVLAGVALLVMPTSSDERKSASPTVDKTSARPPEEAAPTMASLPMTPDEDAAVAGVPPPSTSTSTSIESPERQPQTQRRKSKSRAAPPPKSSPATTAATATTATGRLTIGSMPWADVRIGGRTLRTDVWRLELPPGRHVLHARTGDGREQDRTFQIQSGEETRIVLDWSRR